MTPSAAGTYTYAWTPRTFLSNPGIKNPSATPLQTTKFYVKVASSLGCIKTDSVVVKVNSVLAVSVSPHADSLCKGQSSQLKIITQGICGTNNSTCSGASSTIQVGNGTYTSYSDDVNPYSYSSLSTKRQMLITKAELNALGLTQGSTIQQLGFNIISGGGYSYQNFTIKMACTSLTSMNSNFVTSGMQTVFNPKTITTANGVNYYTFDNNYDWDGISNLLVEVCFSNTSLAAYSYVAYTYTGLNTVTYTTGSAVCDSTTGYYSYNRPNIYLKACSTKPASLSYQWSPATGLNSTSISNPLATPITKTTYKVVATDGSSGCAFKDSVTIVVGDDFALNTIDTSICSSSGVKLTVIPSPAGTYTYTWSPTSGLSDINIKDPVSTATTSSKYYLKVVSPLGCIKRDSLTVTVKSLAQLTVGPKPDTICSGQPSQLSSLFKQSCGVNGSTCTGATNAIQVGTGTYTSYSDDVNPYSSSYLSTKRQILITKAELNALGLTQGSTIQQLGFNITSGGGYSYQNFTIKMACTSLTSMNSNFVTSGMQTVFNPKTITTTNGVNYYTFDNSYDWDGVSNLLVEVCFSNTSYSSYSYVAYTYTPSSTVTYTTGSAVCDATTGYYSYYRPNIYLKYCATKASGLTYSWTPATGLSSTSISNPVATPATTVVYKLNAIDKQSNCQYSDTVQVVVVGSILKLSITKDTTVCSGTNFTIKVVGTVNGGLQWYKGAILIPGQQVLLILFRQ